MIAFSILLFFLFLGRYILHGLNISQPALSISGGIILFLIAIKMIFPGQGGLTGSGQDDDEDSDPLLVPLAVPLQAGPSTITSVILLSSQQPGRIPSILIALIIASVCSTSILLLSDFLRKLMGIKILRAIERLMGMILTTMAVQMLLTGIEMFYL